MSKNIVNPHLLDSARCPNGSVAIQHEKCKCRASLYAWPGEGDRWVGTAVIMPHTVGIGSFNRNTVQKVAGTLRVPSGKLRKTLFFLRLRHMECACYFE